MSLSSVGGERYLVGQAGQASTINNVLTTPASAASLDVGAYRSALVQVISTGASGTYLFEGSNDGSNFVPIPVFNQATLTGTAVVGAITASVSQIGYIFPLNFKYIRLRIATALSGTIRAFTKLMDTPFSPSSVLVNQATAGNLNATVAIGSGTLPNVTTVGSVTNLAGGQTAHSSASTGAPVRVGGRVNTTLDQLLTQGDACDLMMTSAGQAIQKPYGSAENDWQYSAANLGIVNTTASQSIVGAGAAIRNYITSMSIMAEPLGAATEFVIKEGGNVIWRIKIPTTGLPLTNVIFPTPLKGGVASSLSVATLTASITGAIYFNAQGYQSV